MVNGEEICFCLAMWDFMSACLAELGWALVVADLGWAGLRLRLRLVLGWAVWLVLGSHVRLKQAILWFLLL